MSSDTRTDQNARGLEGLRVEPDVLTRRTCPGCASDDLTLFWQMRDLPIHLHLLRPSRDEALDVARGDIVLGFCRQCGLVSNLAFDPERMRYAPEYENSLHFSPRFQQYAEELAVRLVDRHGLRGKNIVEIACGKGDFLRMLCERGDNRGVGYDPGAPDPSESNDARVRFVRDYYSERYADQPADFICCRHALEHIAEPMDFLRTVRASIGDRPDTLVMFEVPNVLFTLRHGGVWDVIYEHCLYFSPGSLRRCFERAGFAVHTVTEAFDGQFLCIEATPAGAGQTPPADSREDLESMANDVSTYASNYEAQFGTWAERLSTWQSDGQRVVLWGSGSKGIMFLNLLKIGDEVAHVVDINPRKQGMFTTGTGHEIVSPESLKASPPDVVVLMNPIYEQEVRTMLAELGLHPTVLPA